jgi:hypothetical protein
MSPFREFFGNLLHNIPDSIAQIEGIMPPVLVSG